MHLRAEKQYCELACLNIFFRSNLFLSLPPLPVAFTLFHQHALIDKNGLLFF